MESRGNWSSNLGFLFSMIGSAVGLGNIWAFPYKMGTGGGFAFLVIYIVLAALIGFPMLLTEFAIGRRAGKSALLSFGELGGKFGTVIGFLATFAPFLIFSFYSVLGGYCIGYVLINAGHLLNIIGFGAGEEIFATLLSMKWASVALTFLFMLLTFVILKGGIKDGIEKFSSVGMPLLALMLIAVVIRSVTLPGAAKGIQFMFKPSFEIFSSPSSLIGTLSIAGGQVFFSLSLAMGISVTYGSYLDKKEDLVKNSVIVIASDTVVALLAGLAVLPAAFALGGEGAELAGPKLLFITLENVFMHMGKGGSVFGIIFYLLVVIAALTSAVSIQEVLVTFLSDESRIRGKEMNRTKAVALTSIAGGVLAFLTAADGLGSSGMWVPFRNTGLAFSSSYLDFLDFLSEGLSLPICALLTAVLVGWVVGPGSIESEISSDRYGRKLRKLYSVSIRVIVPIAMIAVLIGQVSSFLTKG